MKKRAPKLHPHDTGTMQLIIKRAAMSPADPTRATCPIDVLHSRQWISDEAYDVACYFRDLRHAVFGKAHPGAVDLLKTSGGRPDEYDGAQAESRYRAACRAVNGYGRQCLDALENVVVYERFPAWLCKGHGNDHARLKFTTALGALLAWRRGARRVA